MNGENKSVSLALIGLLTAGVISVFQSDGYFDLFDCFIGVMMFLIAEAYEKEMPKSGPGSMAFAMIEGAAFFLILSPFNFFNMRFGNEVTHYLLGFSWPLLSGFAYLRRARKWYPLS